MKVFFLGTGAAEGVPALFCHCSLCEEAWRRGGPDIRTRCSILVDDVIKIDLPPDTLAHVHRYPQMRLSKLEHLLFTHSHDDHFAVRELQYLSPNFAPHRVEPLDVYATAELFKKMMLEMENFFEEAPLRFHSLLPFDTREVGHLRVTPITARHKQDELCLNYILSDGKRALLYGCDTGWYEPDTWEYLANHTLDAIIFECGLGKASNGYDGHLNIGEVIQAREKLLASGTIETTTPVYVTHISHTGLALHEELTATFKPHNITVAYDGMEITF